MSLYQLLFIHSCPQNFLREKVGEVKLQLSAISSEETEEEGCRENEDQEEKEPHDSETNVESDTDILNDGEAEDVDNSRIIVQNCVKEIDENTEELASPAVSIKNSECSPSIITPQESLKSEIPVLDKEIASSKDEILKDTTNSLLKISEVSRSDTSPSTSTTSVSVQPAKRKVRHTLGGKIIM